MDWDTLTLILKWLTEQLRFHRARSSDNRDSRISAETSMTDQQSNGRSAAYQPDFREKRHEFSQHIGC
jgi:hypothetical protein